MSSGRLYNPPFSGEYLQGDIFKQAPATLIRSRPLRVGRLFKPGERESWGVHKENGLAPNDGFHWTFDRGGEQVLVQGYLEMAMLLTHDCEIENDPQLRVLALIRPASDLDAKSRELVFSGRDGGQFYAIFPLQSQAEEPTIPASYVDFRRLTTVRQEVLEASERIASLSESLREAIADSFWDFLFRRVAGEQATRS